MKDNEKHLPKYWVGHNRNDSDVFLNTAYKYRQDTDDAMQRMFGLDWEENNALEIILVQLEKVQ